VSAAPLIRSFADFIDSTTWAGLPSHVRDSARDRLLDAMSTAVASRDIDVVRVAAAAVDSGSDGACTILPSGTTGIAQDAAFVNAVAVHALLFEDIHLSSADHPGAVVVPAALAAAEDARHVAGYETDIGDLLTAIVVGYELQLFLGAVAAQGVIARGFRTTSVFGTIAAAAAAAHLWRLPPDRIEAAVAVAANLSFGLIEAWSHGSMEPYLQVGVAARNGLLAAILGRSGAQTAGPTFEGPNGFLRAFADTRGPEAGEDGLGDWRIGDVSCKPYPVSGAKLSAVDSALAAQAQGLSGSRIRAVTVHVPPIAKEYPGGDRKGPFATMSQAQDSAQFCVAAALLGRPMSSVRTFTEGFGDGEVSDLTQRIEIVSEPGRVIARVDVELDDGSHIVGEVDSREGHRPTIDRMADKLRELSGSHWAPGVADAVIDVVCGSPDRPVADLSRLLRS
jgi:2-methylcitrate dehydratase PrpD